MTMKILCKKCGKQLKLSEKMVPGIEALQGDDVIRVKCPQCQNAIVLGPATIGGGKQQKTNWVQKAKESTLKPPAPPDIGWLIEGDFSEGDVVENIPLAMILMEDSDKRVEVAKSVERIGYKAEFAISEKDAIERMQFTEFSAVILHEGFVKKRDIEHSPFHIFMKNMAMSTRRFIFYVLIGKQFSTLYDLQALSCSANLVVNDRELLYFDLILRKAIPDYENLFGPITEELRIHGK